MLARAVFRWGNRSALRRRLTTAPSVVKPIEKKDGIARIASGIVCGASVVYNWHFMGGPDTFGKWFEEYPVLNVIGCALLYPTSRFIAPNNVATAFTGSFFLGVVVILCHPKYNIIPLFGNTNKNTAEEHIRNIANQVKISDVKLADIAAELKQYVDTSRNVEILSSKENRNFLDVTKLMWSSFLAMTGDTSKGPNDNMTPEDMAKIEAFIKKEEEGGNEAVVSSWLSSRGLQELLRVSSVPDGDGNATFEGFHRAYLLFILAGIFIPARVEMMFEVLDLDHSGALDRTELLLLAKRLIKTGGVPADDATVGTWLFGRPATAEEIVESWLRKYDDDKNGELSRDEFKAMAVAADICKGVELVEVSMRLQE